MSSHYQYTPYIWLVLASASFFALLGIYAIRHRTAPGAVPFAILTLLEIPWVLVNGLGLASTEDATRIFWFKFESAHLLPLTSASLWFVLEYAGLAKWLTRRLLVLLAIFSLVPIPLILTNEIHHLVWTRIWFDGYVHTELGPVTWVGLVYGYFLSLLQLMALAWLFIRSPRHRWIAGGLIIAAFSIRCASLARFANWNPTAPMDPMVVVQNLAMLAYASAVFGFRMLDVVSVARDTVIEGMADGMMVLDTENRIADFNEAVQKLLGIVRPKVIGREVAEILQPYPDLLHLVRDSGETQCVVFFGDNHTRWYQVSISPIFDRRGFQLGRLISLYDITEQRRIQEQLLDHQRTLAMLRERELLARELHDGVGQTLAAAHLQVKTASELLAKGQVAGARISLDQLAEVIREGKAQVGDYMLGVKTWSSSDHFFKDLRQYVTNYSRNGGVRTELIIPPEIEKNPFGEAIETQLHRIIQEALVNIRKHANARSARVIFDRESGQAKIAVEDDGQGFDAAALNDSQGFGLRSMKGRAEAVGARFEVKSSPGHGTKIIIQVPLREGKP